MTRETQTEIQRKGKQKVVGEFRDIFVRHAIAKAAVSEGEDMKVFFDFIKGTDVKEGDRLLAEETIFDVGAVRANGRGTVIATAFKNELETGLWRLKEIHGCDIKYGIAVATSKDPEAEAYMDSWVGTYIVNLVSHYDEIKNGKDISSFYGLFNHDIPAACVGAGPSLDKNVHLLHDFPGLIICADRAYKSLRARGIDPDFVYSVDCHYDLVAEMLNWPGTEKHRLVLNTCSDPAIAKAWKGKIYWYNMRHPGVQFTDKILPALLPKFHSIPNLGNAGNASAFFADYVGLSPIVLVGHDYGYTGGKMHAKAFRAGVDGSTEEIEVDHNDLLEKRSGKVRIDDIVTYSPYLSYRDTMQDLRRVRGLQIYNCTEGGILTGLPCLPLAEMIERLSARREAARMAAETLSKII